ncbi:outer membrane beta-barrel family protein [Parabacteroides segnis]|jgi:outer membrane receptor protein involved in Fe transport|uniref:TonB-dependent receptor n=1 Tax=Parabacteroides segnis TaxID=2763058 RepID=A0ABR7DWL4_9BACT|nr:MULTISPECIES: outer membrane beta-barrel family protein [Parabacteroides]MBC5641913.1 TonB-dependent receptor [Parabacteroides segnis]MCM0712288.1 TonB-dependent receptor family protein [Parabacteroides sp. TA-V-105]
MMKKKMSIVLAGMLLCFAPDMFANETDGKIKGIVMDGELGGPLEFVTVQVKAKGSDKIVQGSVTGSDGNYTIGGLKKGEYVVTFSYIGYEEVSKNISISSDNQILSLGELTLTEDANQLGEVEVVAKRPQMRFEIDRKVFDATQDIAAEGGSASDLLSNIPSVEVDNEGSVSLRGNSSVTIWINGKASGLTADNQADILDMMPAGDIKQVEVITNPSARYSPEGTAGIINIILKDDRKPGYYGSVKVGADTDGGYQASGNINYSSSKVDAYANLNYRNREFKGGGITSRLNTTDNSFLDQTNDSERQHNNWFGRFGATWHITKSDDLAFNVTGMTGGGDNSENIHYNSIDSQKNTIYTSDRMTNGDSDMKMYNLELNYVHKFSENSNIDLTVSNNQWRRDGMDIFRQSTVYTDPSQTANPLYQTQENDIKDKTWEVQADYTNKISDMARIEAGYKGTFQRNASPVDTYTGTTAEDIRQDESLYNRFLYNQDVHALYMTYGGKWNKLSYQAGLRGEYWRVDTRSLDFDQEFNGKASEAFEKDYFKLFPSAFISYSLPKNNELQVNYTRRLRRPWGGQLNSFRNISDASNISFGNPELTPEYSHSFELNYIKSWESGHTLSLSGYYRSTDDVIQRIRFLNTEDNVMYTTSENVAKSQASGLEIVGKDKLFKILDLTTTVNLYYSKLDGFSYLPQGAETPVIGDTDESFAWNVRMIANFSLPWGVSLQGTGNYNSKQLMAQGHREPNYSVDLGLRKSFLSDKLTLSINARDLLDSRKFRTVTAGDGFWQDSENWRGGRRVGFTLTYNFGNMNKKKDKSKSRSEEPDMFDME